MMRCDAEWLGRTLAQLSSEDVSPILNLGSSTQHFRTVTQPHIQELVFGPLEGRGIRVVHSDLKVAPGVDVSADIFDDADFARLKAVGARTVVCTHMYEHVRNRDELTRRLLELLPEGGRFFVTVPSSYHEHNDPIDTMFRPSPEALASMFQGQRILETKELTGETYWAHVRKRPVILFGRHFFRFLVPFLDWRAWKRSMRKLYWLFHPYKVAAVAGRKVGQASQVAVRAGATASFTPA
jgi:SAM-dependent methyltransferase